MGADYDLPAAARENCVAQLRRLRRARWPEHARKAHDPRQRIREAPAVMTSSPTQGPTVAIAGGGLAGLAAGCALSSAGFRVTLFERRPYLGGRASSYQHPGTGEIVDNCQHVLLGCCTKLLDF